MTKTNLKTVASVDNFIWIGKKKYTRNEAALHRRIDQIVKRLPKIGTRLKNLTRRD